MIDDRERKNAQSRASYRRNRDKALLQKRAWREANPGYMSAYAAAHRAEKRATHYRLEYGLTQRDYDDLLALQGGHCAMCEATVGVVRAGRIQPLFVDHDATTGRVRGLLCSRCNSAIGYIDHRVEVAAAAVAYLTTPPAFAWFGKDEVA